MSRVSQFGLSQATSVIFNENDDQQGDLLTSTFKDDNLAPPPTLHTTI